MPALRSILALSCALMFLSPGSLLRGVAAVDWWLHMESGTNGTELTTNILNSATIGRSTAAGAGWTVYPGPTASKMVSMKVYVGNEQPLSGPMTVSGTTYTDSGSTRSFSSRNDRRSHYAKYVLPVSRPKVSVGCYLRLENLAGTWGYYDLIHMDGGGHYVVLGLRDAPWDPDHPYDPNNPDDLERRRAIRVHSQSPPYVGVDIPIYANKTYWITMLWDTSPWDANPSTNKRGKAILRVYDPQTWLPVGEPSVLELSDYAITAPLRCEDIRLGRCDDHDEISPGSFHFFDDLMVNETGSKWPLMPGEISFAPSANDATGVSIPAALSALATDPEGDPLAITFHGRTVRQPPETFTALQANPAAPSGSIATTMWSGLSFDTEYEWYASASDGTETVASPVWRFRTTNNTPPAVAITVPQNNALFPVAPADLLIEADTSDSNGVVVRVEFFAGEILLGEDIESPFAHLWSDVHEGIYTLTVVAHDNQGAQTTSAPITITVGGPPLTPTALVAVARSASEILLTWTEDSNNEIGFEIDQSLDGVSFSSAGTVGPGATNALMTGLQPATAYYYVIRAFNAAGPSANSDMAGAMTPVSPPAAPSALTANAVSSSQINLAWVDNASDETGFEIYQSQNGVNFASIGIAGPNATNAQVGGLQPVTAYHFRVRAFNAGGYSGNTNTASATTPILSPSTPIGLTATAASTSRINLAWTDTANNETGFRIERSIDGVNFTQVATVSVNVTIWANTGLPASTAYSYRVRAYNTGGTSDYSSVVSATTLATLPAAPASLQATALSTSQINLTWKDNATNEVGFEIHQSQDGISFVLIATAAANVTNIQVNGLRAATSYSFQVRAFNNTGFSGNSSIASATTLPLPPSIPAGLAATATSTNRINLTWTDTANNEAGFRIERSIDGVGFTQVATVSANVTNWANAGLSASTTYQYRVRAYNAGGISDNSNVASATTFAPPPVTVTFTSVAAQDGFLLESTEVSLLGGSVLATDNGTSALRAGDDSLNRQFKAVVSFNTSVIPDGAVILSATLRLKRGAVTGTNPFQTHAACSVDIKSGNGFNESTALTAEDFQAPADATQVAELSNATANGQWSTGTLNASGLGFVDKAGTTQFRISFTLDDNNNLGPDLIGWYSGENATSGNRPQLVIVYQP